MGHFLFRQFRLWRWAYRDSFPTQKKKTNFQTIFKDIHQFETVHRNNLTIKYISCTISTLYKFTVQYLFFRCVLFSLTILAFVRSAACQFLLFVSCYCWFVCFSLFLALFSSIILHTIIPWNRILIFLLFISVIIIVGFRFIKAFFSVSLSLFFVIHWTVHMRERPFTFNSRTQNSKWHFNWAYGFMTILCLFIFFFSSLNYNL